MNTRERGTRIFKLTSRQWVLWLSWDCITKQVVNTKQKAHIVKSRRELKMGQVLCCQREMLTALLSVSTLVEGCSNKMVRFSNTLTWLYPQQFFSSLVFSSYSLFSAYIFRTWIVRISTFITLKVKPITICSSIFFT